MDRIIGNTYIGFTIQRILGEGGMAYVYYAENNIGKAAAIKALKPHLAQDESIKERFRQEAMVMVRLKHPNIREVYDLVNDGSNLVIVMEYLEGSDLAEIINRKGTIAEKTLRPLLQQILEGLGYAHHVGIVHRDIKPSNIFYTSNRQIKLLDFGIAKITGELGQTKTGQTMGSPLYMSPEQVRGSKEIDHRTDIYSLGVSLYHLLSGQKPYDHRSLSEFEIQTKIVKDPLPKLKEVSLAMNGIVSLCTEKEPRRRFQNCQEIQEALKKPSILPKKRTNEWKIALFWSLGGLLVLVIMGLIGFLINQDEPLLLPQMVFVEGGSFEMGCDNSINEDCFEDELPAHIVQMPSFNMGVYEVTNEQFCQFLNDEAFLIDHDTAWFDPSPGNRIRNNSDGTYEVLLGYEKHPVKCVNWHGAKQYAEWLSEKTGKNYQLPTESQWEYAARSGHFHSTSSYAGSMNLDDVAVYNTNSESIVGSKNANSLGIYDLTGNVWEWVLDDYYEDYTNNPEKGDYYYENTAKLKVMRGGCYINDSDNLQYLRVFYRNFSSPNLRLTGVGFRVVEDL